MKQLLWAAAILMLCALEMGCAQMFTAKTTVNVVRSPDGTCTAEYSSDKEQIGLEAEVCGGKVKVDKSGTLESVVAAAAQTQLMIGKLLEQLVPLLQKATAGVP